MPRSTCKPTDIPESHRLSELEEKLLNVVQTLLRSGPYPEAMKELFAKIQWNPKPEAQK